MSALTGEGLELQAALAGEYSLEREIGRGGMGIVYLARDVQLDRHVAIKVLPPALATRADLRERFIREARTAAGLSHPHIVPIHRVGEATSPAVNGAAGTRFVFFVMSYVAGETLGERLRSRGPLPPAEAMRVLREVAWALAYAHGRGIVHRDVKPDNILLEEGTGRALVTDFGIAQDAASATATDPGKIMGTAHFMSPEQAASAPVDARSDLYSLGVVGYLAVSGRLPFKASGLPALMERQSGAPAPSVSLGAPGLPSSLAAAIDRCLEREPDARFASGEELAAALAPERDTRALLSPPLRGWLGADNPASSIYLAWSGVWTLSFTANVIVSLKLHSWPHQSALWQLSLALAPLVPVVGFHVSRARRMFRAGFSLRDLRSAIEVDEREQREGLRAIDDTISRPSQLLRAATYVSGATAVASLFLAHPTPDWGPSRFAMLVLPWIASLVSASMANVSGTPLLPARLRGLVITSLRDRLWKSRLGDWIAKRMNAPAASHSVGDGIFRPTEVLLGDAASDLFAALPEAYRRQLGDLPSTVAALEARAAVARSEVELLANLGARSTTSDPALVVRREEARAQLAHAVAALEGIRLDLIRLHAGSSDLAPLTTLLDAARQIAAEIDLLADANAEVEGYLEAGEPTPV
ncbi:MAG TPA: serine/threonine-protein kinase [Gemmatimonadaceae bacterium]|jgi:serine/threonine-protein kinase|nr:serine/threonine-protein kinase [Gemmatimonadaceae bacterium]